MNHSQRLFRLSLLIPAAAPTGMAMAKTLPHDKSRPNVIIIVADDLGYGDLECYGAKNVQTPNVNRLAQHGIRFSNGYAVAATSTPSRYSLLTGEYAWRRPDTDVARGDAGLIIRPQQLTVADVFKSKGYNTCAIGKWHLGLGHATGEQDWNAPLPAALGDLGFDYHYIMAATADRVPCVFIENGQVANYDSSSPIEVNYERNFEGVPTAKEHPELLYNQRSSHGHDQAIVNGIGRIGYMRGGGKALWKDENIADSITAHAINYIRRQGSNPFFMYFATNDVHVPRFPHARFRGKSRMGVRGDAIAQFDWSVGEIVKQLDRQGILDNTLIILTSDNGAVVDDGYDDQAEELLNGHDPSGGLRGNKYSAFEGGTRVPFIISWGRNIPRGIRSDALVSQVDLLASLSHLIQARIPKGCAADSRNHLDAYLGKDTTGRPYVIQQNNRRVLSVRTAKWKYIEPSSGEKMISWGPKIETGNLPGPQLYNLQRNAYEAENVATTHPQVVFDMQEILRRERER